MKKVVFARVVIFELLCAVGALSLTCCESRRFSHDPPSGCGSLVVDNQTGDRLLAYVDGSSAGEVAYYDYEIYDLEPGVHRVVIDEKSGFRNWRGDVDILEGQLAVMQITADYASDEYSVRIYFE